MTRTTRWNWNSIIQALVLVRLGQELGTESAVARAVHDFLTSFLAVMR